MNTALIARINHYITDNGAGEITGTILNQVLRDMVLQTVAEVTYASLSSMIASKQIVPGTVYKITNRGDRGIFLTGLTETNLTREGMRIMLCPKTYKTEVLDGNSWKGVWHSTKAVAMGDLCIWSAKVWKNLTGSIGNDVNDRELDAINWQLIDKASFSNKEYIEVAMPVTYDYANDWIELQSIPGKISAGVSWAIASASGFEANFLDMTDWNDNQTIYTNVITWLGVWNNAECRSFYEVTCSAIYRNYGLSIMDSSATSYSYVDGVDISGTISGNHCFSIINVNTTGNIAGITHPNDRYSDITTGRSFYLQYSFIEEYTEEYLSGPIESGNFVYNNMLLHQDVLLTEMTVVGVGLAGDVGAKISIGLEIDDETYVDEVLLSDLNNGLKITTLGNKTTAPFRRFKIAAVAGDVTGGILKISGKYL